MKNAQSRNSISKKSPNPELQYLKEDTAHITYAQLMCREDDKSHKKSLIFLNQEFKDISLLKPSKKGLTTFELEKKKKISAKKISGFKKI